MSRLFRRLSSALLLSTMLAGACSPATRGPADAGTLPGVGAPAPIPVAPAPARELDRDELRAALAARRQASFERFLAYREARVYPRNTYTEGFEHVWLDADGNLCAAATLIAADWGRAAAEAVAREDNFVRMADITDGPLADWVLTSGLTHAEIVAIQVPGWQGGNPRPREPSPSPDPVIAEREAEIQRLYMIYVDVERQLTTMWDENLEAAVDALMARPDLARDLLAGISAGPGRFGAPADAPGLAGPSDGIGFAQPPPA